MDLVIVQGADIFSSHTEVLQRRGRFSRSLMKLARARKDLGHSLVFPSY